MIITINFHGLSVKIKRIDAESFDLTIPIFMKPYLEKLDVGAEFALSVDSIMKAIAAFKGAKK